MEIVRNIDWFKREIAPSLQDYKITYNFFEQGDFGSLDQVEFNSKKIGGNIDFWGLGWLGVFVWDYRKEHELMNSLLQPHEEEEKKRVFDDLQKLLMSG